ncbi:Protein phosphatase 1 regulatory subunit 3A [Channa argus]|uniref:Protein phosphatase 1 regulatory subunit 3A n=1 Tax=Channa argus TaxID=215402 RepID=A0A6G1Q4I4_CHAAH|nr:Protein phosphatase 1 regulatory subunit 3A [Channa argus]KAK2897333.1 hypothetical protein Q8A73_013713 [Channa argus]
MSFLTIPSQEGLFTTTKTDKSAEEAKRIDPMNDEDNDEEDDDEDSQRVRFIPRCSPVPRKRGPSIYDETAEYMRIHLALSAGKRVSFADTTGGDLVDVKEFVAFDSDEEGDSAKWEEEEAKYRKPERHPTYLVHPEFDAPADTVLLQAVHTNKVEVERVSPVENEPLAFSGVVRVLNISFHKAVYIRSTMDNWASYFDHPAEYVQGSHDGDTDQFSFKLSFAPPYITHGSRIEFVVRYETSDGDFWANNSSMNYAVTLLLAYEDNSAQTNVNIQPARSILKPPKEYSVNDDLDSQDEHEKEEDEAETTEPGTVRPSAPCPLLLQPDIDVERTAVHPSGPSVPPNQELPFVDGTLSAHTVSPVEQIPCTSSETTLQFNSSFVLCASESVQPNKSQPLPRLHCELGNQTSEQPTNSSPSALLPERLRSESSHAGGEEIPSSEDSCVHLPTAEVSLCPTGGDGLTESSVSRPCLELPYERVSAPWVTEGFEQQVAMGSSEGVADLSEGFTRSAAQHEGSRPPLLSSVAESQECLEAESEAPASPEVTANAAASTGVTELSQNLTPQSASAREEEEDAPQISPDTLLENLPNTLSEASDSQPEHDINRNLIQPSIMFLSGVVSLSIMMQEPSTLFFIGLLLVLNRL